MDYQLSDFAKTQPNTKISLVTFNNEVTVFGDDKNDAIVVTGDKLNDNDALVKVGTEASLPASIKYTRESLSSKLFRYTYTCAHTIYTHTRTHMYVCTHSCTQHTHTRNILIHIAHTHPNNTYY